MNAAKASSSLPLKGRECLRYAWTIWKWPCLAFPGVVMRFAGRLIVTLTLQPRRVRQSYSLDSLTSSKSPLNSLDSRDCVIPIALAACICVHPASFIMRFIEITRSAFASMTRASSLGKPRSSKMFPSAGVVWAARILGMAIPFRFRYPFRPQNLLLYCRSK